MCGGEHPSRALLGGTQRAQRDQVGMQAQLAIRWRHRGGIRSLSIEQRQQRNERAMGAAHAARVRCDAQIVARAVSFLPAEGRAGAGRAT